MKHNLEQSSLKTGNGRNMLVLLAASALAFSSSVSRGQVRNKPSLSQGTSAMYAVPPRGQQSNERSINLGSQPISVAFANQTNENLVAHWIDLNGVGQEIGLLVPGQVAEITTFPGHVTIFSSGSRRVATFRASTSSQPAYAILGPGGNTANMGPVTQFNPSVTGNQISSAATGITLSDIGRFFRELANRKQSSAPGGGSTPGTNIQSRNEHRRQSWNEHRRHPWNEHRRQSWNEHRRQPWNEHRRHPGDEYRRQSRNEHRRQFRNEHWGKCDSEYRIKPHAAGGAGPRELPQPGSQRCGCRPCHLGRDHRQVRPGLRQ